MNLARRSRNQRDFVEPRNTRKTRKQEGEVNRESARMIAKLIHQGTEDEVFSATSAAFCKIWIEVFIANGANIGLVKTSVFAAWRENGMDVVKRCFTPRR
jgi:hypothetical protein